MVPTGPRIRVDVATPITPTSAMAPNSVKKTFPLSEERDSRSPGDRPGGPRPEYCS